MANKKKLALIAAGGVLLLLLNGVIISLLLSDSADTEAVAQAETPPELSEEQRALQIKQQQEKYYRLRFTLSDAIELCNQEVRSRNSNLIQLNANDLATRFNKLENVYMVKFDTVVGTSLNYEEKSHTCHVDPKEQAVSYYQEILRKQVFLAKD